MQWLITGCSPGGLGYEIAVAALNAKQSVIATSRNPNKDPSCVAEIEKLGGKYSKLDVSQPSLEEDLRDIVSKHGEIDVLVNNAGYGDGGPLETMSLEAARAVHETNFWGPIRAIKTLVPAMRERKSGTIVNIGSATFWLHHPATSIYTSSKFALEGLSASLAGELAAFNIRVLSIVPGAMRTSFFSPSKAISSTVADAYKGTPSEYVMQVIAGMHGTAAQDPKKTAEVIVGDVLRPTDRAKEAAGGAPSTMMALGKESVEALKAKIQEYQRLVVRVEEVAQSCDFQ